MLTLIMTLAAYGARPYTGGILVFEFYCNGELLSVGFVSGHGFVTAYPPIALCSIDGTAVPVNIVASVKSILYNIQPSGSSAYILRKDGVYIELRVYTLSSLDDVRNRVALAGGIVAVLLTGLAVYAILHQEELELL